MKGERLGEFEELILLAVCNLGDNAYGVSIQEILDRETGRSISIGAIYAALDRMERKGFVTSRVGGETKERGGRRKRLYRATNTGVEVLAETHDIRLRLWKGLGDLGLAGRTI
jgi:DNA-binding PadR family transcriptional regulator